MLELERVRQSSPLLKLLAVHSALDDTNVQAVRDLLGAVVACSAHASPLPASGVATLLMTSGWAGAVCNLPDGRRQIVSLLLPGDIVRTTFHQGSGLEVVAFTSLVAVEAEGLVSFLDNVQTMPFLPLAAAWAGVRGDFEKRLVRHAIRLGRMTAYERTADLFLELLERCQAAGVTKDHSIGMPLTQDVLADHLGLSAVHMNRTMQLLRRDGLIADRAGRLTVPEPARLARASPRPCGF